jgi:hypothetical protein
VHVELTGVYRMPAQPRPLEELSSKRPRKESEKERGAEAKGEGAPEKTKGRAPRPVPSSSAIAEHHPLTVKCRAPSDGLFRDRADERQNPSTTFAG